MTVEDEERYRRMLKQNQIPPGKSLESREIIRLINVDMDGKIDNGSYPRIKKAIEEKENE